MPKASLVYHSLKELYETFFRGNEVEFEYKGKKYYILPRFKDNHVLGVLIGQFGSNEDTQCLSIEEFRAFRVDNESFEDVFHSIEILSYNF